MSRTTKNPEKNHDTHIKRTKNPDMHIEITLCKMIDQKETRLSEDYDDYYYNKQDGTYNNVGEAINSASASNRITLGKVDVDPSKKVAKIIYYVRLGRKTMPTSQEAIVAFGNTIKKDSIENTYVYLSATILQSKNSLYSDFMSTLTNQSDQQESE